MPAQEGGTNTEPRSQEGGTDLEYSPQEGEINSEREPQVHPKYQRRQPTQHDLRKRQERHEEILHKIKSKQSRITKALDMSNKLGWGRHDVLSDAEIAQQASNKLDAWWRRYLRGPPPKIEQDDSIDPITVNHVTGNECVYAVHPQVETDCELAICSGLLKLQHLLGNADNDADIHVNQATKLPTSMKKILVHEQADGIIKSMDDELLRLLGTTLWQSSVLAYWTTLCCCQACS
jgi:hypothetical protein